jgi:hypothetical protein
VSLWTLTNQFANLEAPLFHKRTNISMAHALLHIVPFCEGPNKKSEGFAKEKQKT